MLTRPFPEGCNASLPTTGFQRLQLSDTHHGLDEPNPASEGQRSLVTGNDAASQAPVPTKRYVNSTCAIFKLPPELFSYVFSISVLCDRPGTKSGVYTLGWISVTQVCHYWREVGQASSARSDTLVPKLTRWSQVALSTPSLWRYLDFAYMSRRWCSEMLRRSGNCPLEILMRVTGFSGSYPAKSSLDLAWELVKPEYSTRLAGLQLDLSSLARNTVESLIQSLQQSAPRLESLELRQASWEPMTIGSLASCRPSFKRLALHNVFLFPWVSPIFVNLHELHITFDRHRLLHLQDILPSYVEVAAILGRMSELRCLELRNVFAEGSHPDLRGLLERTIPLPKLQTLTLIDQQDCDLLSFASLLDMPPTTCAEIKTTGRVWKGFSDAASLYSHYGRTFGPARRLKLLANGRHPQVTVEFRTSDALSVESSAPSQLRLEYALPLPPLAPPRDPADGDSLPLPPMIPPTPHLIALHLGDTAPQHMDGLLNLEVVSHAPTATTATAGPSGMTPSPDCWWTALFSRATQVRYIRATYRGAVDGLLEALQHRHVYNQHRQRHNSEQWSPRPLLLFPDLRAMKLSLVDLDETVIPPSRTRADVLLDCLERRRELGVGIRELEVVDGGDRPWMRKLREIVPRVVHAEI